MISNFSEVEKSLKRCLKEKVSITAATVVGFLIAGTVAFGAVTTKDVEFTTVNDGGVKVKVKVDGNTTDVGEATDSISVADYEALTTEGALKNLLTVTTEGGVTTFAGVGDLGIVKATATNEGPLTLITTDKANTSITSSLTIEAAGFGTDKTATAMEALEGHTVTNGKDGDITVGKYAVGMKANAGATAINEGKITVNAGTGTADTAIGMSAATDSAKGVTTLTNNGTITVTKGIGISVDGTGEAKVAAGEISVADGTGNVGINIANTGTGKTIVTGGTIKVTDKGTGINAKGNVELEDIAITLNGAGTGIVYTGETDTTVTTANISTKGMTVGEGAAGITATMSKAINSTLDITTGSIETKHASAFGIKIAGADATAPSSTEKPSTAIVTTTLGETKGTGVDVTGAAHNDIIVNLKGDTEGVISKTGVNVTDNKENGLITVNVDQNNLSVGASGSLVNIAANTVGTTNVNIYQNVELAEGGNIVTAADDLGVGGVLNVNLNVAGEKGLNVAAGTTALNLAEIDSNGTAYVKNSGTVIIAETGTLLAGSDTKAISLTNQGLITLETVTDTTDNNSKISTGTKVEVANYGTITLKDMDSKAFLAKVGEEATLKTLTLGEVQTVLKNLGVVTDGSEGNFESVGFIKFSDGEVFTAAEMLKDSDTVANLIVTSNQSDYKAFGVAKGGNFTLTSNNENICSGHELSTTQ